jgi:arylsulfatase A-like enzyme
MLRRRGGLRFDKTPAFAHNSCLQNQPQDSAGKNTMTAPGLRKPLLAAAAAAILLAPLVLLAPACGRRAAPRNFVLITLDTQRADYISAYDREHVRTPNIDSLAGQGTIYKNAYSLIPITLPSHATMFFSEPPQVVKSYNNGETVHPRRSRPPLALLFKKNGFRTAAFVSLGILEAQFGLSEGFDTYDDKFRPDRWYLTAGEINDKVLPWLDRNGRQPFFLWVHYSDPHDPYAVPDTPPDTKVFWNGKLLGSDYCLNKYPTYRLELTLEPGRNELAFEVENPFYDSPNAFQARLDKLKITSDPEIDPSDIVFAKGWFHRPADDVYFFRKRGTLEIINRGPRRPIKLLFRGKLVIPVDEMKKRYGQEVEYMDGQIGRLWEKMKELGLFQNTAVVMVGDHGEGLGEYLSSYNDRHVGHIHFLYNVYTKVPFIVYKPGFRPEAARTETVSLLDVAPTVASIMGFRRPDFYQGRDLARLKKGAPLMVFEATYRPEAVKDKFALLESPWHIILTPGDSRYELFNMDLDPGEQDDVYDPASLPAAVRALKLKLDKMARDALGHRESAAPPTDRTQEMLKSLGYIKN